MPVKIGEVLHDRYRIEALLGEGGMGAVYRAVDLLHDSRCAVKEFRLGYLPAEDETRLRAEGDETRLRKGNKLTTNTRQKAAEQFLREAKLLAKLDYPNLPKVTDYFSEGEDYYLVMNLIEGQDLAAMLEGAGGKPLPEGEVMGWMKQVMDALRYCHEQGVIHRDVKPANVIVTREGKAYLVDFGIAKPSDASGKTTIGARATTPGYSPPEQYGQGHTDVRSDIYALGAMMYALLTGREPKEAIDRLTGKEMPSVLDLNKKISMKVDAVVTRAMSIRPDDRFQSVFDIQKALINAEKSKEIIVARIPKTSTETVCVGISEWTGKPRIFIRIFERKSGEDKATMQGIDLPIDDYQELLNGVKSLENVLGSDADVARIRKYSTKEIRIQTRILNGIPYFDLWNFAYFGNPKEWHPLKESGVWLKIEIYPNLLQAVIKLGQVIKEQYR